MQACGIDYPLQPVQAGLTRYRLSSAVLRPIPLRPFLMLEVNMSSEQSDLTSDQVTADLDQAAGDREQAIADRDQQLVDDQAIDLAEELAPTDSEAALAADADPGNRADFAQERRYLRQDQLDLAQDGREMLQELLEQQQEELDFDGTDSVDVIAARADADVQRAEAGLQRAEATRKRDEEFKKRPPMR